VLVVSVGVLSVRVNENVDVGKDQPPRSISSRREALSSRPTPGWRPPLPNVGGSTASLSAAGTRAQLPRTASPTPSLRVRPSRAARSFASASKSSGRSTVVRTHQSVTWLHQDAHLSYWDRVPGLAAARLGDRHGP